MASSLSTRSPTSTSGRPDTPSKGARSVRSARNSRGLLQFDGRDLGQRRHLVEPRRCRGALAVKLLEAVEHPFGFGMAGLRQGQRQPLVRVVEAQQHLALGVVPPRGQVHGDDLALGLGAQGDRALGPAGADHLDGHVVRRPAHRRHDDGHPLGCCGLGPGFRFTGVIAGEKPQHDIAFEP